MDRRGFIQSFIGAAAMAMVPGERRPGLREARIRGSDLAHGISPYLHDGKGHDIGFGLAQVKMEGASIPYDPGLRLSEARVLRMKEGLTKMFGDEYEKLKRPADDEDEEV